MMTPEDSYEENKKQFVERLMAAGCNRKEALDEWDRIQDEEDEAGD